MTSTGLDRAGSRSIPSENNGVSCPLRLCGFRAQRSARKAPALYIRHFREKRARLTRRRFHFPQRRLAENISSTPLPPDGYSRSLCTRARVRISCRRRMSGGRMRAHPDGSGKRKLAALRVWDRARARARTRYRDILSRRAIRGRRINRSSIRECIPNFIETRRRLAYLAAVRLSSAIFSVAEQTMSLSLSRSLHSPVHASKRLRHGNCTGNTPCKYT